MVKSARSPRGVRTLSGGFVSSQKRCGDRWSSSPIRIAVTRAWARLAAPSFW